jgi:hypothetical protein
MSDLGMRSPDGLKTPLCALQIHMVVGAGAGGGDSGMDASELPMLLRPSVTTNFFGYSHASPVFCCQMCSFMVKVRLPEKIGQSMNRFKHTCRQPAEADAGAGRAALHWGHNDCRVPQVH